MFTLEQAHEVLSSALLELRQAIDVHVQAKENLREARLDYDALEAEVINTAYANALGKNAECRKAEVELILFSEKQRDGVLYDVWNNLQNAITNANCAEGALDKARYRFTCAQASANLSIAANP